MKELVSIQQKLNAPKEQFNRFGGYKYRSCEDILAAVKPLLGENECTLTITDEMVLIGNRIYVKAMAKLTNKDGQSETATAFAREEEIKKGMDAAQITGSASSYARKYALNGLLCIDDTKDADATNTHGKDAPQESQPAPSYTPQQLKQSISEANKAKTVEELHAVWKKWSQLAPGLCSKGTDFSKAVSAKRSQIEAA